MDVHLYEMTICMSEGNIIIQTIKNNKQKLKLTNRKDVMNECKVIKFQRYRGKSPRGMSLTSALCVRETPPPTKS